jgi:outer membrane protein TolC
LRRKIATEVTGCAVELDAAGSAVTLATEAIVSAEEAYRVTDVQVRAGTATVTDLLDAQAALTQVRLNLVRARYARAMASVLLAHATGA